LRSELPDVTNRRLLLPAGFSRELLNATEAPRPAGPRVPAVRRVILSADGRTAGPSGSDP